MCFYFLTLHALYYKPSLYVSCLLNFCEGTLIRIKREENIFNTEESRQIYL